MGRMRFLFHNVDRLARDTKEQLRQLKGTRRDLDVELASRCVFIFVIQACFWLLAMPRRSFYVEAPDGMQHAAHKVSEAKPWHRAHKTTDKHVAETAGLPVGLTTCSSKIPNVFTDRHVHGHDQVA